MKKNKEKYRINRNRYNDIKRYDHGTMEEYLTEVYMQGVEKGIKACTDTLKNEVTEPDYSVVKSILLSIKGIGKSKAETITKELEENYVRTYREKNKEKTARTENNKGEE